MVSLNLELSVSIPSQTLFGFVKTPLTGASEGNEVRCGPKLLAVCLEIYTS